MEVVVEWQSDELIDFINLYLYEEAENTDYFDPNDTIAINDNRASPAKINYKAEADTNLYLRLLVNTFFLLKYRITFNIDGKQNFIKDVETSDSFYDITFARTKVWDVKSIKT